MSIIITTFNRTTWLRQSIHSCMDQEYPEIEVIVVDDGSANDEAKKIAADFPRVRYFWQANQGLGGARNTGVNLSNGEYIQFLDDDDWLLPGAVSEKASLLSGNAGAGMIYSDLYITDENGIVLGRRYASFKRPLPAGDLFPALARRNFIPIHALLWKKSILQKVGMFPVRSGAEDWECLVKAAEISVFDCIDKPLGYYRLHHQNMTRDHALILHGDAEVQKIILNSEKFSRLPEKVKVDHLFHYSLRQWLFGDEQLAAYYLNLASALRAGKMKIILLRSFFKLGKPVGRIAIKQYWKWRNFFSPSIADYYYLKHR